MFHPGMNPSMYGGHPGMYGGHPGMMHQSSVLEVPLSSGAVSVNLMTVHPGKHVLKSRADYEKTEEAYQSLVSKNYFGNLKPF
jgi:hypothetical protein